MDLDAEAEILVSIDTVDSDEDMAIIGRDDVSNYNPDNILPESPAVIHKIRQWLEPTPYLHEGGEYRRHLASHVEGTGQWLTATETYQKWHTDTDGHGLLWIKRIPGSGKSVFAAMLANALAEEGHPVLFFFFRQIIDANHEPVHMLRDWLAQILEYSPPLQRDLSVYTDQNRGHMSRKLESLGTDDLWKHLKTALAHMPRVYLIADALDEMSKGNDECLRALAKLGLWRPGQVKVLITSRPVNTVEAPLREFPALRIRLEERLVDTDIATYVEHCLAKSAISVADRALIREAVPGCANGLFLYAKLALDAFLEKDASVGQILRKLPTDLNTMYTDLLAEHARRSGVSDDIQHLILCWVTHATRPLRLIEMAEMLRITYDASRNPQDLKTAKSMVRVACGPLLEIHPDETVSVVHHSLTEFLLGSTRSATDVTDKTSLSFPILMRGSTHEQLALSCLQYLQWSGCLDNLSEIGRTEEDADTWPAYHTTRRKLHSALRLESPFAEYACKNWAIHAAKSFNGGLASAVLLSALDELLAPGHRLDTWLSIEWWPLATKGITPWHIAARYGLSPYLEHLVRREGTANVTSVDSNGQTPLFHAAEEGHAVAFCWLPGVNPLTQKTRENPGRRCGNAARSTGHTPLMYACQAGHVAAVEAFLPHLKRVNTVQRALCWASNEGQAKVVKRLIQHPGVNVNAEVRGHTALFGACAQKDVESIETLLMAGADATILCRGGSDEFAGMGGHRYDSAGPKSPLEAFCGFLQYHNPDLDLEVGELEHGLELLLRAGADIHRRGSNLKTPLHHAAGRPALLRLLLRAGADPNAESSDGGTLLHTNLSGEGGWEVIKLLVEEGKADINKRRHSDGKTPVLVMCDGRWDRGACLRFINEFGPDCTIADLQGNTPLHGAASLRQRPLRDEVIEALLAAGARIDQRNKQGEMPIHVTEDMSAVELLVKRGADLEARDCTGATLLMRSVRKRPHSKRLDMAHLLSIDARLDTKDFEGRTLVHETVKLLSRGGVGVRKDLGDLEHVLGLGVDPRQADYAGNTVLHELMERGSRARRGDVRSPIDAVNHRGQTLLHVLSAKRYDQAMFDVAIAACKSGTIDLPDSEGKSPMHLAVGVSECTVARLISAGADISAATHEGLTPLHLAASTGESNILGMLLTTIETTPRYRDPGRQVINATDGKGRTPLYYACLSGRPESVALLLKAGAEVKRWSGHLLSACSQFEGEERRETQWTPTKDSDTKAAGPRCFADLGAANFPRFHTRLDEILRMLADHGLNHSGKDMYGRTYLQNAIDAVAQSDSDHTVRCLCKLRAEILGVTDPKAVFKLWAPPGKEFSLRWAELRREAATRAFHEVDPVSLAKGDRQRQEMFFLQLLERREFDLVETAPKTLGWNPCLIPSRAGWTVFHALVALGHAALLARIATDDDIKLIDDPEWRKEQEDPSRGSDNFAGEGTILPLVLAACKCDAPNMAVLRLLVEKLNASVDASHLEYHGPSVTDEPGYSVGDSPLLSHEALPYILSHKPDLEARNHNGETPLHKALANKQYEGGPLQKQAAKLLIAAGADVNAVANSGKTCLAAVDNDAELVRLLIAHGAVPTAQAVFAAIDNRQVGILEALLSAGERVEGEDNPGFDDIGLLPVYLQDEGKHALHRAATMAPTKDSAEMVRVLLVHRVDPFGKFSVLKPRVKSAENQGDSDHEPPEPEFEQRTVVHEVLLQNGIIGPFLDLPGLDLEHRNNSGQSLLLAACDNPSTFCSTVEFSSQEQNGEQEESHPNIPLLIDALLRRGANPSARDNHGRNALQTAFHGVLPVTLARASQNIDAFAKSLSSLLAASPSLLLNQVENEGKTALHYALAALAVKFKIPGVGEHIISLLLTAGADPTRVDASTGDGALHLLVRALNRNPACPGLFRRFVALGLDVNARNARGETPLFGLLQGLPARADEERTGDYKPAPEDDSWRVLEDAGADFTARDDAGRNMLHLAAEGGQWVDVFKRLVEKGLDPAAPDHRQRTSLDVAAACRNEEVLGLFEREEGGGTRVRVAREEDVEDWDEEL
ncbi:ankyrin-2 [Chaetomidium leptoderma]|uniref:Ankyrin-2 n=1 Tax=Chaetomidium leptoderma TaxID=669021 RepID=A0AAN6VG58_9PEZI|nr:ankyrin-2 [Chaetomidium leptoderma]